MNVACDKPIARLGYPCGSPAKWVVEFALLGSRPRVRYVCGTHRRFYEGRGWTVKPLESDGPVVTQAGKT